MILQQDAQQLPTQHDDLLLQLGMRTRCRGWVGEARDQRLEPPPGTSERSISGLGWVGWHRAPSLTVLASTPRTYREGALPITPPHPKPQAAGLNPSLQKSRTHWSLLRRFTHLANGRLSRSIRLRISGIATFVCGRRVAYRERSRCTS